MDFSPEYLSLSPMGLKIFQLDPTFSPKEGSAERFTIKLSFGMTMVNTCFSVTQRTSKTHVFFYRTSLKVTGLLNVSKFYRESQKKSTRRKKEKHTLARNHLLSMEECYLFKVITPATCSNNIQDINFHRPKNREIIDLPVCVSCL